MQSEDVRAKMQVADLFTWHRTNDKNKRKDYDLNAIFIKERIVPNKVYILHFLMDRTLQLYIQCFYLLKSTQKTSLDLR